MGMFVETSLDQDIKMLMTVPNPRATGQAPKTLTITNMMHQTIVTKLNNVR